jgi:two-component system response regulator CpxR
MAVISIFSASYCHGEEVAESVATRLGYELIDKEFLEVVSEESDIALERLVRAMRGGTPILARSIQEQSLCIAHMRAAIAARAAGDNVVCHGFAGHLLPRDIEHIIRVCLVAGRDYRISRAMESRGLSQRAAVRAVTRSDEARKNWTEHLFNLGPWDKRLYDIKIPMHSTSIEDATKLICENAQTDVIAATPESRKDMVDFAFAARVNVALVEKGQNVSVFSDDGNVTILVSEVGFKKEQLKTQLKEIAEGVPGVRNVEILPGTEAPKSRKTSGILLVDDEREFVQTLSERLQMRDLSTAIAYDGEQALTHVDDAEPEVMILDLRMPGIDGIEVLRKVKKDHPDVEVIVLTGHGTDQDKSLTKELGAFAFLEKPVEMDKLAKTVRDAYEKIAKERAERKLREGERR